MTKTHTIRPTLPRLRSLFADSAQVADRIALPLDAWPKNCHGVSIAIVRSGMIPEAMPGATCRVARGWTPGVGGQHSWVVIGNDCYDEAAIVVDATLFSYDSAVTGTVVARARTRPWTPHGAGSIWTYGCPPPAEGEVIDLTPEGGWSQKASAFMAAIGYGLDLHGWTILANAPVGGWPAGEIIEAMAADERTAPRVPIDRLGMLTDRNPGGLYLPGPELG